MRLPITFDELLALPSVTDDSRGDLPDRPGIYFAIIDSEHLVYIGITGVSLRRRWRYHNHLPRLRGFGALTVAYIANDDTDAVYYAEIAAVAHWSPVMNDTPGFCIRFEVIDGRKTFRKLTWDEARPPRTPRPTAPAPPPAE